MDRCRVAHVVPYSLSLLISLIWISPSSHTLSYFWFLSSPLCCCELFTYWLGLHSILSSITCCETFVGSYYLFMSVFFLTESYPNEWVFVRFPMVHLSLITIKNRATGVYPQFKPRKAGWIAQAISNCKLCSCSRVTMDKNTESGEVCYLFCTYLKFIKQTNPVHLCAITESLVILCMCNVIWLWYSTCLMAGKFLTNFMKGLYIQLMIVHLSSGANHDQYIHNLDAILRRLIATCYT